MIIKREIDGKTYEFELTSTEKVDTFYEVRDEFDEEDVLNFFADYTEEERKEKGLTDELIDALVPEIAQLMRRYIDKYDMDWEYARYEAVRDVLSEMHIDL